MRTTAYLKAIMVVYGKTVRSGPFTNASLFCSIVLNVSQGFYLPS